MYSDKLCLAVTASKFSFFLAPFNPLEASEPRMCLLGFTLCCKSGTTSSKVSGGPGADVAVKRSGNG